MADVARDAEPVAHRRFGSWAGWLLIAYVTVACLFLYSGAMGHSVEPAVHPWVGTLGWVLAGLSPAIGYISYQLLHRRLRSRKSALLSAIVALAIFLLCQTLGMVMLRYALPGQALHLG